MELSVIQSKIYEVRGQRVMLDFDLAKMYGIETRTLKQSVKSNIERFDDDFMFVLSNSESKLLISNGVSQNVIPQKYNTGGAGIMAFLNNLNIVNEEIKELKEDIFKLQQQNEESLEAINDLSEDNQKEFDNIYLALSELAAKLKKSQDSARKKIGFRQSL